MNARDASRLVEEQQARAANLRKLRERERKRASMLLREKLLQKQMAQLVCVFKSEREGQNCHLVNRSILYLSHDLLFAFRKSDRS